MEGLITIEEKGGSEYFMKLKIFLPLLLLCTMGMLAALPHFATANETGTHEASDSSHQSDHNNGHEHENETDHETGHEHDNDTDHEPENETDHQTLANFHIRLEGDNQVPEVNTTAFGFANIRLFQNGTSSAIEFTVVVCDIANVTHSHIHVGNSTTNGPIVIPFFDNSSHPFSSVDGCNVLAHGIRGPSDLMTHSGTGIGNWTDFVHALTSGDAYVNVHTIAHPGGEIRGQIVSEQEHEDEQEDD